MAIHPQGDVHTPYGATEALPVASISAGEVLAETLPRSQIGQGTCVGRRFPGIEWRIIAIRDEPIPTIQEADVLAPGEIGELIVRGPVVTREYVTRAEANAQHKIRDGDCVWHRMGDVGYLDPKERFWFCGRLTHRLRTPGGTMFTIPCEAIFNQHPAIYRSALVGIGPPGRQVPVIVAEPWPDHRPAGSRQRARLVSELRDLAGRHPHTQAITRFLIHPALPVDIRHNAKIRREQLALWAAQAGSPACVRRGHRVAHHFLHQPGKRPVDSVSQLTGGSSWLSDGFWAWCRRERSTRVARGGRAGAMRLVGPLADNYIGVGRTTC